MSVQSRAELVIYEVDGKITSVPSKLELESHRNQGWLIVLRVPGASSIAVALADLNEAIRRCSR